MRGVYHSCEGCSRRGSVPGFFFFNYHFFSPGIPFLLLFFFIASQATSFSGNVSLGKEQLPMKLIKKHRISLKAHLGLGGRIFLLGLFFSLHLSRWLSLLFLSHSLTEKRYAYVFFESVDK